MKQLHRAQLKQVFSINNKGNVNSSQIITQLMRIFKNQQ